MASPSFTAATPGNLTGSQALWKSWTFARYVDYSTKLEAQLTARVTTSGSVTAASYVKHEAYAVYGTTTLSNSVAAAATVIPVSSTAGMAAGQKFILENEQVTISSISGLNVTITAGTQLAHSTAAPVYLTESIATYPGTNSLGGTASTTYAKTTYLSTGQWVFLLTNTDTANAVLIELSVATIDAFA